MQRGCSVLKEALCLGNPDLHLAEIAALPERPILQGHNANPGRIWGPALLGKPI